MSSLIPLWLAVAFFWLSRVGEVLGMTVTPYLEQSFFFDWNKPGQPYPIPVTKQCEVNHITWSRGAATGPNPTAPYYLQVYTSVYTVPLVIPAGNILSFDWAVPFAPGTLYQICMFDKFGNTGGCQDTYTVIPSPSTPTCANVTFPPQLTVTAIVDNGPMSQYGWIDQCSDISLVPSGGTGPYTLTVAPSLHPPYNITAPGDKPINWTVSLDWSSQFYVSLADSAGNMWANGPLHAGGGGTIACLSGNPVKDSQIKVSLPITIGSGVGGLVLGLLVGALAGYLLLKRHLRNKENADRFVDLPSGPNTPHGLMFEHGGRGQGYQAVPTLSSGGMLTMSSPSSVARPISNYQVEPFMMPDEDGYNRTSVVSPTSPHYRDNHNLNNSYNNVAPHDSTSIPLGLAPVSQPAAPAPVVPAPHAGPSRNVYVVHHDSHAPPVTIYHEEGTQVVELPPRYAGGASEAGPSRGGAYEGGGAYSDSRSDGSRSLSLSGTTSKQQGEPELKVHQARQPNRVTKPPR